MSILAPSARLVGNRINRKEDPRLLTGRGRYVDDVVVPGMVHVAFARSDIARGRIVDVDVDAARRATGVVAVLTATDLNSALVGQMGATPVLSMGSAGPNKVLADDEVRYVGDPYALVVAESRALAEDAVEPLQPVADYTTALESAERVHPGADTNVAGSVPMPPDEELRTILETAPHVAASFVQNRYLPVPMETRGIVAWWEPKAGTFEVWVSNPQAGSAAAMGAVIFTGRTASRSSRSNRVPRSRTRARARRTVDLGSSRPTSVSRRSTASPGAWAWIRSRCGGATSCSATSSPTRCRSGFRCSRCHRRRRSSRPRR